MQPRRIELRILSAAADSLGVERYPLVLLHWDGRELRCAERPSLPAALESRRGAIRRTVARIVARCEDENLRLGLDLDSVEPVREGDAGGTAWSQVREGYTKDPEAHFRELARALHLEEAHAPSYLNAADLKVWVRTEGESLVRRAAQSGLGDRVAVDRTVKGYQEMTSPLSWLTGRWTHTHCVVPGRADEQLKTVASVLDLRVPPADSLLVVCADVGERVARDELERGIAYLRQNAGKLRLEALVVPPSEAGVDLSALVRRVEGDLGLSRAA